MPTARIRKSGNSNVIVISPEIMEERNVKVGEVVEYQIFKGGSLKKLWGRGRHLKIDAQKAKDELRKEW